MYLLFFLENIRLFIIINYFCVIELMLKTSYKSDKIYLKTLRKKIELNFHD
jgi:hypothetical protein